MAIATDTKANNVVDEQNPARSDRRVAVEPRIQANEIGVAVKDGSSLDRLCRLVRQALGR